MYLLRRQPIAALPLSRPYLWGIRTSALLEIGLFLLVALFIDAMFGHADRFMDVNPHPFWVIVLAVTIQYGTTEGMVAALCSSVALLYQNLPPQSFDEENITYLLRVIHLPVLWFVAAVLAGELRLRELREREQLTASLRASEFRNKTLAEGYEALKVVKEDLESRFAGQLRSAADVFHLVKELERTDPGDILMQVDDMVETALAPLKFSVYAHGGNGFEATSCVGWDATDRFSRRIGMEAPLYREIAGHQRVVCVINEEDEQLLAREGVMAGPLIDSATGDLFGMLKIEQIRFSQLNLSSVETFKTLCEWIGIAYANAIRYQRAREASLYALESPWLSQASLQLFEQWVQEWRVPAMRYRLRITNLPLFAGTRSYRLMLELAQGLAALLPAAARVFDHPDSDSLWLYIPAAEGHPGWEQALCQQLSGYGALLSQAEIRMESLAA
jgi:hypothetical protein